MIEVLEYGARKYSAGNWKNCEDWSRYWDAAQRHLQAYRRGEEVDPETGLNHLAHAACSLFFLLESGEFPFVTEAT